MEPKTRLFVSGSRDQLTTFRVVGPASMAVSVALKRSVEASLEEGATIRIDLRECPWMDSTFLGTLLVLARRARARGLCARLLLVSPSAECLRVLDQTGVQEVFDVVATPEPAGAAEWTEIASGGDKEALVRNLLRAHEALATFPGTEGAFGEVAREIAQDAQRIGELCDPTSPERK
jgi:anti-anti-sigma factor